MQDPVLHSIQEARKLLGGISRNAIYKLLRSGDLPSVLIGLPAVHLFRSHRRVRLHVDHDRQPVASLDAIALGRPISSPLASTHLASTPGLSGWALTPCVVAYGRRMLGTLSCRHLNARLGLTVRGRSGLRGRIQHTNCAVRAVCAGKKFG